MTLRLPDRLEKSAMSAGTPARSRDPFEAVREVRTEVTHNEMLHLTPRYLSKAEEQLDRLGDIHVFDAMRPHRRRIRREGRD